MSKKNLLELQDKFAYLPIFAKLLKSPEEVLSLSSGYKLTPEDFAERFHKVLFTVIHDLYSEGVTKITKIEINAYLKNYVDQERIFNNNSGNEYIEKALELEEEKNFEYHFNKVKKFSLLRRYVEDGYDISEIYDVDLIEVSELEERNERFNSMSIRDIIKHFDGKNIEIKSDYLNEKDGKGGHFSDNIKAIFEKKKKAPSFGSNFMSGYLNTITRGARRRKLYCTSGDSGSGKSRSGLANLLFMCIPEIYMNGEWIKTNNRDKGLFITTELEEDEIKIPAVCFIAEVDEEKVQLNDLTEEEQKRLEYAIDVLERTPIWFEEMFDFDDDDLEHEIEKHVNKNGVTAVQFDYLHSTIKMFENLAKRGARGLQEHQVLRISSIRLKNICNRHNIWMGTSTQLNQSWKTGALDQGALEGSKSIINKLDMGALQIPLRPEDEDLWDKIKTSSEANFFGIEPTHTINVYKNRGNRWKLVRIWVNFNLGTCRMVDMFVTNYKGEIISMDSTMVNNFLDDDEFDYDSKEEEKVMAEEIQQAIENDDIDSWFE